MQFQLPTNLQTELVAYDPQLKALARTQKQSTTKKSKYPLGNPVDLIPNEIITADRVQDAIDAINKAPAPGRYREFTKVTSTGTITHAVLYHYEQVWYAAWLPPKGKEADYIYGYTYAYKDIATVRNLLPHALNKATDDCVSKPSGRCTFVTYTQQVTNQDVINGKDTRNWNMPSMHRYAKKSQRMYEPIDRLEKQIEMSIPQWKDSRNIFERIKTTCIAEVLTRDFNTEYWKDINKSKWLPSVDIIFSFINNQDVHSSCNVFSEDLYGYKSILHILDTPYFRKWIQNKCNESIESFNNPDTDTRISITQPWLMIFHLCKQIKTVHNIWGNACPLDYYQTNLDALLSVSYYSGYSKDYAYPWLVNHMPVASFFALVNKFYETKKDNTSSYYLTNRIYDSHGISNLNLRFFIMVNEDKIYTYVQSIWLIFGSIAIGILVLVSFVGYLFSRDIIFAIRSLNFAMQNIEEDESHKNLDISRRDEIGEMTKVFISMKEEIINHQKNLERIIEKRTSELQLSLNEVTQLKEHQDGDYFLTSLLLKPLISSNTNSDKINISCIICRFFF
jgi:hypothetical protein